MAEYAFLQFPAEAVHVDPEAYDALPESARKVFEAVKHKGPLTHNELRVATGLPARTIRFAVKRLKDRQLLASLCSLRDCRKCYFYVDRRCVGEEALEAARVRAEEATKNGRLVEWVGTRALDARPAAPVSRPQVLEVRAPMQRDATPAPL